MQKELIRGHLETLVLSVIDQGAVHGYAIVEQIRNRSDGALNLPEGSIYPALYRLEHAGLLKSQWTSAHGRRRRLYRLTRAGKAALATKTREWLFVTESVSRVLGVIPKRQPT